MIRSISTPALILQKVPCESQLFLTLALLRSGIESIIVIWTLITSSHWVALQAAALEICTRPALTILLPHELTFLAINHCVISAFTSSVDFLAWHTLGLKDTVVICEVMSVEPFTAKRTNIRVLTGRAALLCERICWIARVLWKTWHAVLILQVMIFWTRITRLPVGQLTRVTILFLTEVANVVVHEA